MSKTKTIKLKHKVMNVFPYGECLVPIIPKSQQHKSGNGAMGSSHDYSNRDSPTSSADKTKTIQEKRCIICNSMLKIQKNRRTKLCVHCSNGSKYKDLKEQTDRRFKLYDIYIKQLVRKIREYEPNYERNDDEQ